jgi:hypothetical protein
MQVSHGVSTAPIAICFPSGDQTGRYSAFFVCVNRDSAPSATATVKTS